MSDNEDNKNPQAQQPAWVQNYIKRLQAEGFVRWDSCTWINPKDIPVFLAKGKIKRSRRRRALFETLLAEAKAKRESEAA